MKTSLPKTLCNVLLPLLIFVSLTGHSQEIASALEVTTPSETLKSISQLDDEEETLGTKHIQQAYVSNDGSVYWNKSVPVYISLLSSPDSKDGIIIKVNPEEELQPYYFDTEGLNWIRTRWEVDPETGETIYPKKEVLWPVMADGLPPASKATFTASGKYVNNGTTYYSGDVSIEITAKDKTSGVESIFFSVGNEFKEYSSPISVDSEKDWELKFYAVDKVGNYSSPEAADNTALNFTVDKTSPKTSFEIDGPSVSNIISPNSTIRLLSQDEKSGVKKVYYNLKGDEPQVYSDPLNLSGLEDGFHELNYSATDNVNNSEESNAFVFYLDKIAPEVTLSILGDSYSTQSKTFVSTRSKLELAGSDNKAGLNEIHYQVDDDNFNPYSAVISTDLAEGFHSLRYYANDKVQNTSETELKNYYVDATPPTVDLKVDGPQHTRHDTLFVRNISTFTILSGDPGSYQSGVQTISYTVNSGSLTTYDQAFSIEASGIHSLAMSANDNVNNQAEATEIVVVDNEAPLISHTFSIDQIGQKTVRKETYDIYPDNVSIYLAATDHHVGSKNIFYKLGNGKERLYTTPITGFKAGANVRLQVRAVDFLGNESQSELTFSVE